MTVRELKRQLLNLPPEHEDFEVVMEQPHGRILDIRDIRGDGPFYLPDEPTSATKIEWYVLS